MPFTSVLSSLCFAAFTYELSTNLISLTNISSFKSERNSSGESFVIISFVIAISSGVVPSDSKSGEPTLISIVTDDDVGIVDTS